MHDERLEMVWCGFVIGILACNATWPETEIVAKADKLLAAFQSRFPDRLKADTE